MRPLFTTEELRALRRVDEGLERAPVSERELAEAEARDADIAGETERLLPGQPMIALPPGWLEKARAARFATIEAAARACGIGPRLMWILECGGVTSPEIARRVGRALGLGRAQVRAITSAKTAARRQAARRAAQSGAAREGEGA